MTVLANLKSIQLELDRTSLSINKPYLRSESSIYSNINSLYDLIKDYPKSNSSNSSVLNVLFKKIRLISVRDLEVKMLANQEYDYELVKLELVELRSSNDLQWALSLGNIDFFKSNKYSMKLLNKLNLLVNFLSEKTEINLSCFGLSIYLYLNYIQSLLELEISRKYISKFTQASNDNQQKKSIKLRLVNCFINLIDENEIYTLGNKSLNLDFNKSGCLEMQITEFIIFKSCKHKKNDRFANNLFMYRQNNMTSIIELFKFLKEKNKNPKYFRHIWGNLFNIDHIRLKCDKNNSGIKLNMSIDSIYIEYSSPVIQSLFKYIADVLPVYIPILTNNSDTNSTSNKSIKIKMKSANFYFLFNQKFLIYFNMNNIEHFSETKNSILYCSSVKMNNLYCLQYRIDDIMIPVPGGRHDFNYCTIYYYDLTNTNYYFNLIFLIKTLSYRRNLDLEGAPVDKLNNYVYYLTIYDAICTWSLQIHYILYESLCKPVLECKKIFSNLTTQASSSPTNVKLKVLIESNFMLNFLFDYSQDSTKQPLPSMKSSFYYFNTANSNHFSSSLMHTVSIITSDVYIFYSNDGQFKLNVDDISMYINVDDQNIYSCLDAKNFAHEENGSHENPNQRKFFESKMFCLTLTNQEASLLYERQALNCQVKNNRAVIVRFDSFHINFIFNYDFAKLIDHVLNLRKCLLVIHDMYNRKQVDGNLSPDLILNIKQLLVTIEDDPFEVKLAYNYALMIDEHAESVKRRQTLEQRRSIKEQNLETEALEILCQHESKIYLQRSRMIYGTHQQPPRRPVRTELFCFYADNIDLYAICDSEWHGRQKCYDLLRKIDQVSPSPPEFYSKSTQMQSDSSANCFNPADHYSILWCRYINLNVDDFKLLFRDYTQPLLKITELNMFGHVLGSEYEPIDRAKRDVTIGLGTDLSSISFCVHRNMSPFKIYHDLCSKMNTFSFAYGPCWEGCMAQFNLSLDKIIHPSRDPSRPMPWWDKIRLYLHGRLTCSIQQSNVIYHVSMDPYNHTEEMKLVWTNLYFDWTNMQLLFKGSLDIYLNTESKYDDCCLLHLPELEMIVKIEWLCKANQNNKSPNRNGYDLANAHNHVMPCAANKVPFIVNSIEHDSFSQFRSENLNLSFSFVCKPDPKTVVSQPTCKFYASTSRFLQRIKNLLSAITRPTKRGKLFQNVKPRKPILSRHFKIVNFQVDISNINIIYWSSASEEYGIHLECDHFKISSSHKLELIPFMDQLKRRPRLSWSIEMMKCSLARTTMFLMSPPSRSFNSTNLGSYNQTLFNDNLSRMHNESINQAEYDLIKLETNGKSIKFLDSQPAMKNFFMQIDSVFYEREINRSNESTSKSSISMDSSSEPKRRLVTQVSLSYLSSELIANIPRHNVQVKNLKAKWNNVNRDVLFTLYEIYNKSKQLRHNLSSNALKQYDYFTEQLVQNLAHQQKLQQQQQQQQQNQFLSYSNIDKSAKNTDKQNSEFRENYGEVNEFEKLLKKLDVEREISSNVFCNEKKSNVPRTNFDNLLYGVHAVNRMSDVVYENVFIEFINSQVKLSLEDSALSSSVQKADDSKQTKTQKRNDYQAGNSSSSQSTECADLDLDTSDYLIISAAKTNVVQRIHKPIWKSQRLLDKISWSGYLEDMQYFATLNAAHDSGDLSDKSMNSKEKSPSKQGLKIIKLSHSNEYWLSDETIDPSRDSLNTSSSSSLNSSESNNLGMLIKSQKSSINSDEPKNQPKFHIGNGKKTKKEKKNSKNMASEKVVNYYSQRDLQLIVSKCKCEFYIIDFDDKLPYDETNKSTDFHTQNLFGSFIDYSEFYKQFQQQQKLPNGTNGSGHIDLNSSFNGPIDCFTLIHHDLNLCTNSKQYKIIMEIVNNLVLYFRPRRRKVIDKQRSIKFNLQLSMGSLESLKQHIQVKQIEAKELLCKLRFLERQLYHLREKIESEMKDYNLKYAINIMQQQQNKQKTQLQLNNQIYVIQELRLENRSMEKQYKECKKILNELSDELNISISCYKEIMFERRALTLAQTPQFLQHVLSGASTNGNSKQSQTVSSLLAPIISGKDDKIDLDQQAQQSILNNEIAKRYEIWFKHTQWQLNDDDGQTGCAHFLMKNFVYTKVTNQQELDCVEHSLEIESCHVKDLSVNKNFNKNKDRTHDFVLTSLFDMNSNDCDTTSYRSDDENEEYLSYINGKKSESSKSQNNSIMFRIYCKERPPVGIPVIEHLELNVSPLVIKLTNRFYKMMMKFFFDNPNQNQINNPMINNGSQLAGNLSSSGDSKNVSSKVAKGNQRHSYHLSNNEEQLNKIVHLNAGASTIGSGSSSNLIVPNTTNSLLYTYSTNSNTINTSLTSNLSSRSINILPIIQSTGNIRNKLHSKKPSQSSIISTNNIIMDTSNSIISANTSTNSSNVGQSGTSTILSSNSTPILLQLSNMHANSPNIGSSNTVASGSSGANNSNSASNNGNNQLQHEDIEIMKQRSANNNTFLCIKIPEIQLVVSYKGNKEKNIKDLNNVSLLFPLFEVHDKTWTWLDLINALKSHVKKAILSQAIKHKLISVPIQPVNKLINRNRRSHSELHLTNIQIDENEKIAMLKLFGTKFIEKRSQVNSNLSNLTTQIPLHINVNIKEESEVTITSNEEKSNDFSKEKTK